MLSRLKIHLQGDPGQKHGHYLSSLLQGAMIEMLDTAYADWMHENRMHPYSQHCENIRSDGSFDWVINGLNEDA